VLAHGVDASVPAVEVADHADAVSVGRPDGEVDAAHAVHLAGVRAQLAVRLGVAPLAEKVQVVFGQQRAEGIRIGKRLLQAGVSLPLEMVAQAGPAAPHTGLKEAAFMQALHGIACARPLVDDGQRARPGPEGADADQRLPLADRVRAEQIKRRAVIADEQGGDGAGMNVRQHGGTHLLPGTRKEPACRYYSV